MGSVLMTRCCAVAAGVVLGLVPYAVAAGGPRGVFVPCAPDRARMLNDAVAEGNARHGASWEIVLQSGCTYTVARPYGRVNALAAIAGDIRIRSRGPDAAVIARSAAAGTPDFRVLEVEMGGRLTLDRITVRGGSLGSGAGLFNNYGTLTLNRSTVESNHAREFGGGIATNGERAATVLNDTTVRRNSAVFGGGGLFSNAGTTTLNAGRVVSNRATGGVGGGILNNGSLSVLRLDGTAVTGNRAAETAGGIFNGGRVTAAGSPVTGNLPNNCAGSPSPVPGCAD
ncbi:hypothetical protein [Streptomyces phytophilus]|uniref:hypothetical protein n=1 Tax=Streptomyces phytophilus TaxID=722715 RepID=UPI00215DA4A4|nr:hypothetical protein [Streptomyces phytophilus]